eukprot:jgi/Undpi1/833/HiC_scaffold_10.g04297.m1
MSVDPDKLHIIRSKPRHDSHSDAIRHFEGDYECLSNTYKCPVSLRGDSEPYPSVEHALQASKTDDAELKNSIRQAKNAIEAKKIARVVKPAPKWRAESERIVEALIRDKFRRNAKAREILIGTGRVKLVYTNSHEDRVWGVCGGKGENKLGKLLERVRADALAGKDTDVWCSMRFQLATPLDVAVDFAVTKGGEVVAEPSFEGKPIVRMGKLTDNEVVMAHPSVSRSHALLVVDRTFGAFLVDLGASNGSFLDGRRVTPYVPEPVKAGGALLTFAKSKRTYTLTRVETDLREAKKNLLYANMSDPTASVGQPEPDSTVYVGNLEPSVTEDDLREFFADCGNIASIRIPQDKDTGRMRGIAFVAFTKHVGVLQALALHMDDLKGQSIKIRRADAKADSNKNTAKKSSHTRPGGPGGADSTSSGAASGAAKSSAGWGEQASGRGQSGGGTGGVGAPAQSSALELATAAIIRAAAAARANAAAAEAAGAPPASSGDSKRRTMGDERHISNSKEERAGRDSGHRRKRVNRWGDSGVQEGGISLATAAAASVDQVETQAKRRRIEDGQRGGKDAGGREERDAGARGDRDAGGRTERDAGRRETNAGRRERDAGERGERDAGGRHGRNAGGRQERDAGRREDRGAGGASGRKKGVSRNESSRGGGRHGDYDDGGRDGGHGRVRKGEDGRRGSEDRGGGGSGGSGGARAALDGRAEGERNRDDLRDDGVGGAGGGGRGDRKGERQRDNNSASSERHGARDGRRRRENGDNGHRVHHGKTEGERREREDGDRRHGETSRREGDGRKASHRQSEEREHRGRGHGSVGDEGRRRDGHREGRADKEGGTRGAEDGRTGRGIRDHSGRTVRREERRSRSRSRSPAGSRNRR